MCGRMPPSGARQFRRDWGHFPRDRGTFGVFSPPPDRVKLPPMTQDPTPDRPEPPYLTTREVADLLRVKERKVYDLAAAGEIPHRRVPGAGKLLFPNTEIIRWIDGGGAAEAPADRPLVLTGSHDPLLDWALRESCAALASLLNGSFAGLDLFAAGGAALAGLHIAEDGGWNRRTVEARGLRDCVLIGCSTRARGLITSAQTAETITQITDLKGRPVVMRQPGAGAAALLEDLVAQAGMSLDDLQPASELARTESDAAAAVAEGRADAALGIGAMAQRFGLRFVPLLEERFDLLIDRKSYFSEPIQELMAFLRSPVMADKARAMGGYDLTDAGRVRWVSP